MTRYGVDWKADAFREEYFARRDFWAKVQGNGMLPEGVLQDMAFRHSDEGKAWQASIEPEKTTKKGAKAA